MLLRVTHTHHRSKGGDKAAKLMGAEDTLKQELDNEIQELDSNFKSKHSVRVIVKNGDDVRQDQLVVQLIKVMDHCLKRVGLDLKLTVYGILAISHKAGFLEFVVASDGSPSTAIELMEMGISEYLRKHQGDNSSEYKIKKDALDTFSRSMAGYAVITYLLGVGDRHLGNLMMLPDGRMCEYALALGMESSGRARALSFSLSASSHTCNPFHNIITHTANTHSHTAHLCTQVTLTLGTSSATTRRRSL